MTTRSHSKDTSALGTRSALGMSLTSPMKFRCAVSADRFASCGAAGDTQGNSPVGSFPPVLYFNGTHSTHGTSYGLSRDWRSADPECRSLGKNIGTRSRRALIGEFRLPSHGREQQKNNPRVTAKNTAFSSGSISELSRGYFPSANKPLKSLVKPENPSGIRPPGCGSRYGITGAAQAVAQRAGLTSGIAASISKPTHNRPRLAGQPRSPCNERLSQCRCQRRG